MYLPEILKRKTSSRFHGEITKNPNLQSTTWVTALAALVTAKSTTSSRSSPGARKISRSGYHGPDIEWHGQE